VHELDLVRAAAEDVAAGRMLLQERIDVLDAIVQSALDHGIPMEQVCEASESSLGGSGLLAQAPEPLSVL
jgi:hypothetical protein